MWILGERELSMLLFGTNFVIPCWTQAEIWLFKIVPWKRGESDVIDENNNNKNVYTFWSSLDTTSRSVTISTVLLSTFVFFSIFVWVGGVTSTQILSLRMPFYRRIWYILIPKWFNNVSKQRPRTLIVFIKIKHRHMSSYVTYLKWRKL